MLTAVDEPIAEPFAEVGGAVDAPEDDEANDCGNEGHADADAAEGFEPLVVGGGCAYGDDEDEEPEDVAEGAEEIVWRGEVAGGGGEPEEREEEACGGEGDPAGTELAEGVVAAEPEGWEEEGPEPDFLDDACGEEPPAGDEPCEGSVAEGEPAAAAAGGSGGWDRCGDERDGGGHGGVGKGHARSGAADFCGGWVGAEDADEAAVGGEFAEGFFDGGVFAVAEDVEEEEDLPVAAAGGAAFDFGEIEVEVVERGEGFEERAGFVADTEHDGGAVAAAGWAGAFAEDEEACGVGGAVLDSVFEDIEPVELGGEGAAEGGGVGGAGGDFSGAGGAGDLDEVCVREVAEEPLAALGEDVGVAVDDADVFPWAAGHEAVFDSEEDLGADVDWAFCEEVEGVDGGAFGAVFYGDDSVIGGAAGDGVEDLFEGFCGGVGDAGAEAADGGLVGPCAFRAEIGDAEIVFEGEGGGHDFAVDGADAAFGETALHFGVFADEAFEDGFFAFRGIDLETGLFFDETDLVDEVGAFVEEAEQVAVDGIDFLTEVLERHGLGGERRGTLNGILLLSNGEIAAWFFPHDNAVAAS